MAVSLTVYEIFSVSEGRDLETGVGVIQGLSNGAGMMNTSQWRRAVENRYVLSARLKALSDRSGHSTVDAAL